MGFCWLNAFLFLYHTVQEPQVCNALVKNIWYYSLIGQYDLILFPHWLQIWMYKQIQIPAECEAISLSVRMIIPSYGKYGRGDGWCFIISILLSSQFIICCSTSPRLIDNLHSYPIQEYLCEERVWYWSTSLYL